MSSGTRMGPNVSLSSLKDVENHLQRIVLVVVEPVDNLRDAVSMAISNPSNFSESTNPQRSNEDRKKYIYRGKIIELNCTKSRQKSKNNYCYNSNGVEVRKGKATPESYFPGLTKQELFTKKTKIV